MTMLGAPLVIREKRSELSERYQSNRNDRSYRNDRSHQTSNWCRDARECLHFATRLSGYTPLLASSITLCHPK